MMNQELYQEYVIEYIREALVSSDNNVENATNYLLGLKKPSFLSKAEKKQAFERTRKVFAQCRDRPLWFVLKCLGLSQEDIDAV
jgi:site-specific DNA-adenine methylase